MYVREIPPTPNTTKPEASMSAKRCDISAAPCNHVAANIINLIVVIMPSRCSPKAAGKASPHPMAIGAIGIYCQLSEQQFFRTPRFMRTSSSLNIPDSLIRKGSLFPNLVCILAASLVVPSTELLSLLVVPVTRRQTQSPPTSFGVTHACRFGQPPEKLRRRNRATSMGRPLAGGIVAIERPMRRHSRPEASRNVCCRTPQQRRESLLLANASTTWKKQDVDRCPSRPAHPIVRLWFSLGRWGHRLDPRVGCANHDAESVER